MAFRARLSRDTITWIESGGLVTAAAVTVWWLFWPPVPFIPPTHFAILAAFPGILGIANHFAVVLPRFRARRDTVRDYNAFCKGFDVWWREKGWPRKLALAGDETSNAQDDFAKVVVETAEEDLASLRPMTAAAIWSSLLLTMAFLIVAHVAAHRGAPLGGFPEVSSDPGPNAISAAVIHGRAINGLLFAALGSFLSVMWRMINRTNANALTSRFMFTAALRAVIAMMIGLAAGQFDLFGFLKAEGAKESVFFLVGLFTDWALNSLRERARTVFNQPHGACERLPLCYVDGLDDGVIDILDENGIWDVEHLATYEPGELTIRTLYPFSRVIDWIDQAILISYLRNDIVVARKYGITGAIDLAVLYGYTLSGPQVADSKTMLKELAGKMDMSESALLLIASNVWFDYTVEQLYRFWQHHRCDEEKPKAASSAAPRPPPR